MKSTLPNVSDIHVPKGYRAYKLRGVEGTIVAKNGGPTAEQIKTKPTYQKLRNNQKEFGVASIMAKTLRESLTMGMQDICGSYVSGRLTAQFRNLAKYEQGEIGTRPLYVSRHGHHLSGFEFNTTAPSDDIFGAKYFIKSGSSRGQVIIHFPGFIPEETFVSPEGATNFKIKARLVSLSDYTFNPATGEYEAISHEFNGKFGSFESKMFPLLKIPVDPLTIMVSVNEPELPAETGLFLVMALSFYHYENGKFIHLAKESTMSIRKVY